MTTISLNATAPDAAAPAPAPAAQPTPSQAIVADANRVVRVTDASGRTIGVRRMNMSLRRRVFKAISAENQAKERYLGLAMLAACVTEIDGQMIAMPANELQFDALIDRLDDVGFDAIGQAISENFAPVVATDSNGSPVSAAGE